MILKEIGRKIAQAFRSAKAADEKVASSIAATLDAKAEQLKEYEKSFEPDLLMPMKKNIPKGHPEWSLVKCPICGQECWRPMSRQELRQKKMQAACTECGLKIESRRNQP